MRSGKCCRRCKARHLKCAWRPHEKACTRCSETANECVYDPIYQFRAVKQVETNSQGERFSTSLDFDVDQTWVRPENPISFVVGDGLAVDGSTETRDGDISMDWLRGDAGDTASLSLRTNAPFTGTDSLEATDHHSFAILSPPQRLPDAFPDCQTGPALHSPSQTRQAAVDSTTSMTADYLSPASITELSRRYEDDDRWASIRSPGSAPHTGESTVTSPAVSLPTPGSIPRASLTHREAFLLQHFVRKIAPWIDACDLTSQFEREVPKRAMHTPSILYAVLSLSSRHRAIMLEQSQDEASFYHGQCLRLVIEALSAAENLYDESLLATVVLLRVYEEIDHSTDMHFHLRGMSRLLAAIPEFSHSGGLSEAAAWQALRQDIQVSLTNGQMLSLDLDPYERSSVVTFRDDAACANMIVLVFAKIINFISGSADHRQDEASWTALEMQVDRWNDRRTRLFEPIFSAPAQLNAGNPCPTILLLNAPQVVAVQHYHACRILLMLHNPSASHSADFRAARQRRNIERDVALHLATIVGLAESNRAVENANFTAHHLLKLCGYCIGHSVQREHALRFLQHVQALMGWDTVPTQNLLKAQWTDLDDLSER